ncbi:ABC transporter ATP-binding protein [Lacrimispora indolis]|uniref:ABC transporter ATP-binding protein n=1 Tax=Lacrimispora indolis TaxID=69825 RepID=UPI0004272A34|nr:ABC transporter ATP-binding protein [[Clostridium] methoxybenzovorans]
MIKLLRRILRMSGSLRPRIIYGFVFGFIEGIFNVFPLIAIFYIINTYQNGVITGREAAIAIGLLLMGLIGRILFRYLLSRFQSSAGFEMVAESRLKIGSLLRQAPMSFFDAHKQGDLTACMTTDLSFIEMYVMFILDKVVNGFLMTAVTAVFLLAFDWRIGLAAIIALLPSVLIFALLQKKGKELGPLRQNTQAELGSAAIEFAQGIITAKAYGMKGRQAKRISDAFHNSNIRSFQVERGFVQWVSIFQMVVKLAGCVTVLVSSLAALSGSLELSAYLMLLVASLTMFAGLEQCASQTPMLRIMEASLDRIEEITNAGLKGNVEKTAGTIPERFDITFDHVTFGYGKEPVLKNLSFHVPEYTSAALVGSSGSGKSTITKLIPRFYDVSQGKVQIGGIDIRDMSLDQVLSYVSMVFQKVYLFQDTIANNIRFGKQDASMEELIEAAKKACCYDFIMEMEHGFDTMIGEGGNTLSGGQKQRISIARAILKDAPIILLDEATSSIDPENEALIQQAINHLIKNKTLVIIAHNLSAVRTADQILVLNHGQLAESGKHDVLRLEDGLYKNLWDISQEVSLWQTNQAMQ